MSDCVPAKSIAIGVPLVSVLFIGLSRRKQSKLQIPQVIFQGLQIPAGSLMTLPFRRWVCAEEEAEEKAEMENPEGSLSLQRVKRSRSREGEVELTY
jgi:sodium/bile acid cotransporter 7